MPLIKIDNKTYLLLREIKEKEIRKTNNFNTTYGDVVKNALGEYDAK